MLREEKKVVIKSIADLGNRVTAADVASKTGLSLSVTSSLLNQIAAEAGGHLEVSQAGDIAYKFKNTFQSAYLATGLRALISMIFARTGAVIFYILKISFGLFLLLSLVNVVSTIKILAMLSKQFCSERDDHSLLDLLEFFNFLIFRDLIFGGAAYEIMRQRGELEEETIEYDEDEEGAEPRRRARNRGNFFVNCFSFLFGEGNPNKHQEEENWKLAARGFRQHGGVVIKEQLAPYIGPELDDQDSILPALARFDGRPVVTAQGNIAYIFPSLQVTTGSEHQADQQDIEAAAARQSHLAEHLWKFSNLPDADLRAVKIIAGLNLFGTLWMYFIFNHMFHFRWEWTQLMVVYGCFFLIIPMIRFVWETMLNNRIKIRNRERAEAAKIVSEPDGEIKAKLAERLALAPAMTIRAVEAEHLAFNTEKETLEQEFNALDMAGGENGDEGK